MNRTIRVCVFVAHPHILVYIIDRMNNLSLHNQVGSLTDNTKSQYGSGTISWTQPTVQQQPVTTTNTSRKCANPNPELDWYNSEFIHNWHRLQPNLDKKYFVDQAAEREREQELYRLKEQEKELYKTVESLARLQHRAQQLEQKANV